MRPIEAGLTEKDVAAVLRVRRRVAIENKLALPSKRRMHILKLCDELHTVLNQVVTAKVVSSAESAEDAPLIRKPVRLRRSKSAVS